MAHRIATLCLLALTAATGHAQSAPSLVARSPDGQTELRVETGDRLSYSVARRGRTLIASSPISLTLGDGRMLGRPAAVTKSDTRAVSDSVRPVAPTKSAVVRDRYTELTIRFSGDYALELRAYDDGVAYRWVLALPDSIITVTSEEASFNVAGRATGIAPLDSTFMTHYEPAYRRIPLDSLVAPRMSLLPLLVMADSGPRIAITESALEDYPGMYLVSAGPGTARLSGLFPQVALEERARNDRDVVVTRRAPYIARTSGRRALPWRVVMIADEDRQLLENQLVYLLAPANRLSDVSWIRPGKVAWDWWNANNVRGVPFRAGINNDTYKYYIDFAARSRIPYVILDEGWYKRDNLLEQSADIDVPELVRYGGTKNVGVILWVTSKTLTDQFVPALDQFARWGVKGIKVDFMQRDDQGMVNFYWRTAREAAARRLLVDYHGAHKPAGLNRAYPNALTFEGVRGLEQSKWSTIVGPAHDVTLPFTRMLAGPVDYTPGAMINAQPRDFKPVFNRPMSQGTRAHQLAMYVVYESPLQMLADSPTNYLAEPSCMEFLSAVPTVWDETHALAGEVGRYVLVARRRGDEWYIGAMTNDSSRTLTADLSFLGAGRYVMDSWADGINADRNAMDFRRETRVVRRGGQLKIELAPGGGFAARVRTQGSRATRASR
jgi:alpha-glucosidase